MNTETIDAVINWQYHGHLLVIISAIASFCMIVTTGSDMSVFELIVASVGMMIPVMIVLFIPYMILAMIVTMFLVLLLTIATTIRHLQLLPLTTDPSGRNIRDKNPRQSP